MSARLLGLDPRSFYKVNTSLKCNMRTIMHSLTDAPAERTCRTTAQRKNEVRAGTPEAPHVLPRSRHPQGHQDLDIVLMV